MSRKVTRHESPEPLFDEAFLRRLEYLYIVARKVFVGRLRADRRSRRIGAGVEFADFRQYCPGDDFRCVDWNIYARCDRLVLRLFEEQEDLMVYLLLDASGSMGRPRPGKFDYSRRVAAALAYIALANLDRVSIVPFSTGPAPTLSSRRGKGQIFRVFDFLTRLSPAGGTDMTASVRRFVHEHTHRGLVVVISDFFDPPPRRGDPAGYEEALKLLRYNGHEVFVVQVCDTSDARPDLVGDLRLVDVETLTSRPATVTKAVLRDYERGFDDYRRTLERFCTSQGTGCVSTLTDVPVEDLILGVFRQGKFLH